MSEEEKLRDECVYTQSYWSDETGGYCYESEELRDMAECNVAVWFWSDVTKYCYQSDDDRSNAQCKHNHDNNVVTENQFWSDLTSTCYDSADDRFNDECLHNYGPDYIVTEFNDGTEKECTRSYATAIEAALDRCNIGCKAYHRSRHSGPGNTDQFQAWNAECAGTCDYAINNCPDTCDLGDSPAEVFSMVGNCCPTKPTMN